VNISDKLKKYKQHITPEQEKEKEYKFNLSIVDQEFNKHDYTVKFDHVKSNKGNINIHNISVKNKELNKTFDVDRLYKVKRIGTNGDKEDDK